MEATVIGALAAIDRAHSRTAASSAVPVRDG